MKQSMLLCLMACMWTAGVQGQTITLPTKKTTEKTVTVDQQPVNAEQKSSEEKAVVKAEGTKPVVLPVVRRQTVPRAKPIVKKPKTTDNEIYESAEHMPTYPGGAEALVNFISTNMRYPEEAVADNAQGIVQVSFIVEKDGTPKDFEVLDEHHPALEAEAVRVLQMMPKWNPARQHGVKVRVEYVVPVKFVLPN